MDKIAKFLLKLHEKDARLIISIIEKILLRDFDWLDLKKIKWEKNLYRIRKWKIRIVFFDDTKLIQIINVNYRKDAYSKI